MNGYPTKFIWNEATILAMDNHKFSRKMREEIEIEKHIVQKIRWVSHWIVRGALSLLWQIDFSFFFARA